jgi:hypothetical protein
MAAQPTLATATGQQAVALNHSGHPILAPCSWPLAMLQLNTQAAAVREYIEQQAAQQQAAAQQPGL